MDNGGAFRTTADTMPESAAAPDPRLAELTEQALHLLDELAEARLKAASLTEVEARCRELEERLAETRRHVRAARTVRLAGPHVQATRTKEVDVYLWVPHGVKREERERWLQQLEVFLKIQPATLLCRPDDRPAPEVTGGLEGLRLFDCEATHPAQIWNLGIASGDAPLAMFLSCGAVPRSDLSSAELSAALDESVALAQPLVTVKGQTPSLGLREERGLMMRPAPPPQNLQEIPELDAVAPEAFVVQREAASRIGPFDEDIQGNLALVEYCLRTKGRGYLIVGLAQAKVDLPVAPGRGIDSSADRIVLLARHRPGDALRTLVSESSVWDRPEAELKAFARAVLVRLPNVPPDVVGVLVDEIVGLRQQVVPSAQLAVLVQPIDRVLNDALGIANLTQRGQVDPKALLAQALEKARRLATSTDELDRELALEKSMHKRAEQEAQAQRGRAEVAGAEVERLRGEARGLATESERVRAERDLARQELAARHVDLGATRGRLDATAAELGKEQESLRALIASADRAAEVARSSLAEHEARNAQLERDVRAEQEQLRATRASFESTRALLAEREHWIVILLEELSQRGMKLRARKLSPEEERFLAEHRGRR